MTLLQVTTVTAQRVNHLQLSSVLNICIFGFLGNGKGILVTNHDDNFNILKADLKAFASQKMH
jgi:hypothetical protein